MSTWKTFLPITIANLLATAGDVAVTWTSPVYPKLYSNDTCINPLNQPITTFEDDILGSILNIGAVLGPWSFVIIAAKCGRKKVLLYLALPHIIAFLMFAAGKNIYLYFIGRFLAGLSLGAGYFLIPLYTGEIAEPSSRAAATATINIFWCIGDLLPLSIGPYTSFPKFNLILLCIPVTFTLLFCAIGTESPYYLISLKKEEDARKTLMFLRSNNKKVVAEELEIITSFVKMNENGKLSDILRDKFLRKYFFICIFLLVSQPLGGFWAITAHLEPIFQSAETNISADTSALYVGVALLLSSFTVPFLVERTGRRPLITSSYAGMSISLGLLGLFFYIHDGSCNVRSLRWLPLVSLALYLIFFNVGVSTVTCILLSELFPNRYKIIATASCTTLFWLTNFIVMVNYNKLNDYLGTFGTFWFFSAWCLVATIFCFIFVPETRGQNFNDIQKMLTEKVNENGSENLLKQYSSN